MRHNKAGVKLNRTTSHRQAMFRNMVTSLFKHDRIRTTDVKAKELRRWADHMITLAKRGDLHARRQAMAVIREKAVVHKLFEEAEKRFGAINGGYTRIVKIGRRPGDAAPISIIELISDDEKAPKKKKKSAAPDKQKAPKAPHETVDTKTETAAPAEVEADSAAAETADVETDAGAQAVDSAEGVDGAEAAVAEAEAETEPKQSEVVESAPESEDAAAETGSDEDDSGQEAPEPKA